jgi:serine/threonine-protein kinase HipA
MTRMLAVWFNDVLVGHLIEENNIWSFKYNKKWIEEDIGFDLSPSLLRSDGEIKDGSSTRPVQWFFDNLLPEEMSRELIAKDEKFESSDSFSMLEHFGHESAGALTLLAEGESLSEGAEQELSLKELSERIKGLPRTPLTSTTTKKMSLAGAQHKLALIYRDNELFEPIGRTVSTHILKPDHQDTNDFPHSVVNEWFIMQLAEKVGLEVPATYYKKVPEPIYIIERFDRVTEEDGSLSRRHTMDACQLLSLYGKDKYTGSTIVNMVKVIAHCRTKLTARQTLFKWMLFNTLVGNADAHMKNLSLFCEYKGLMLTPHYDLLSTTSYASPGKWGDDEMSWPIGNASFYKEIKKEDFTIFGKDIGLGDRYINATLGQMVSTIKDKSVELLTQTEKINAADRPSAGELRHLRVIIYGVITDMAKLLEV